MELINMSKIDYKKELKSLYSGKKGDFNIVLVPRLKYLQIHGSGDPNTDPSYAESVEALYTIAYTIKFICKKAEKDFVVMPLEGLWYADDHRVFNSREKQKWSWTMLLMIPDFVSDDIFKEAVQGSKKKKDNLKIEEVSLICLEEGLSVQTLHVGSYDDETPVISEMYKFIEENGFKFNGEHHEIYLSDPRKISSENLKTIIRQPVVKSSSKL